MDGVGYWWYVFTRLRLVWAFIRRDVWVGRAVGEAKNTNTRRHAAHLFRRYYNAFANSRCVLSSLIMVCVAGTFVPWSVTFTCGWHVVLEHSCKSLGYFGVFANFLSERHCLRLVLSGEAQIERCFPAVHCVPP